MRKNPGRRATTDIDTGSLAAAERESR